MIRTLFLGKAFRAGRLHRMLWLGAFLLSTFGWAQNRPIEIKRANKGYYKKSDESKNRLVGAVLFEHEGALLYCDSAWLYVERNRVEAFGNVHIVQNDTLHLYGDRIDYDGNTKVAVATGKTVVLQDPKMRLTTNRMVFDRKDQTARYNTGGTIVNDENTLTSQNGVYYANIREFRFSRNVDLTNPRYTLKSDTLNYNTATRIATFAGPTEIVGKDGNTLYSESGFYNTANDQARFADRSRMIDGPRTLSGDSLYYDRKRGIGRAYGNVLLTDTVEKSAISGGYGEYGETPEYAMVTLDPIYTLYDERDSLHIHGDTLRYRLLPDGTKKMRIRRGVRIFRKDLQGVCDSMIYTGSDSTFKMFVEPVLWSDRSQLSGDTIWLEMRNGKMDSLRIHGNAFVMETDTLERYQQIRGKRMKGGFKDDQLHRMRSSGNGQTVYWAREKDGAEVGVNRADCSDLMMVFREGKPIRITFLVQPDAYLYPTATAPPDQLILKGFKPRYGERPERKADLLR